MPEEIAAVIVAGLPVGTDVPARSWDEEIELRTGCPTHHGVLRSSAQGIFSGVDAITSADLTAAAPTVPVLAVHGSADGISPLDRAVAVYQGLPNAAVAVVEHGHHDILNDVTHRSVAATVILFLERLRLGASLPVIVRDTTAG
ncbi:hypothetical protein ACFVKB_38280 [Rhodococcus sp. NPDC127530]|uniref:hypothetical protein n=1 Tax=unclassified Rhodococcus (in: high G+C Gram-positive bacteria) TaxID=192944 RepID=UPI00363F15D5